MIGERIRRVAAAGLVIGALLGVAMVINLFIAATVGTLIPLGLKRTGVDPALASTVFITTFTDVGGFLSWLGLATAYLRMTGQTG